MILSNKQLTPVLAHRFYLQSTIVGEAAKRFDSALFYFMNDNPHLRALHDGRLHFLNPVALDTLAAPHEVRVSYNELHAAINALNNTYNLSNTNDGHLLGLGLLFQENAAHVNQNVVLDMEQYRRCVRDHTVRDLRCLTAWSLIELKNMPIGALKDKLWLSPTS